jgi:hypothetical protein
VPIERFEVVEEFGEAVLAGNAALFVGAGLSRDAGLPGWGFVMARRVNPDFAPAAADLWEQQSAQPFSWSDAPIVNRRTIGSR